MSLKMHEGRYEFNIQEGRYVIRITRIVKLATLKIKPKDSQSIGLIHIEGILVRSPCYLRWNMAITLTTSSPLRRWIAFLLLVCFY